MLLAAGVGRRLGPGRDEPKVLLEFGGETLISRHLAMIATAGAAEVVIVTGFMADELEAAVIALKPPVPVRFVRNPRYREGSVLSFLTGAQVADPDRAMVLMDGDVLYDQRMLTRLLGGAGENVLLLDRDIEPGDEPVKICFAADGTIVDFRKKPAHPYVRHGESVGFFRFSSAMAAALRTRAEAYGRDDRAALEYEEVIRDMILAEPGRFRAEDISDLPWTEIDFPEDVIRARDVIYPQLEMPAWA